MGIKARAEIKRFKLTEREVRLPLRCVQFRSAARSQGFALVEALIAVVISGFIMMAMMQMASTEYRACTEAENQTLASCMAQELIDNARNVPYTTIANIVGGSISNSVTQYIPLYVGDTNSTIYQRPILENQNDSTMVYSAKTLKSQFNADNNQTVKVTLTRLALDSINYTGKIQLDILITWSDTNGRHKYATSTVISESGIHN